MANIDIPAWVARVQAYVANPPVGAPPINKSYTSASAVMEATKPEGLNLHTFPAMEGIQVIQAYYAAVDAAATPAGSGRTQKRKQKGLQKRKASRRWKHRS